MLEFFLRLDNIFLVLISLVLFASLLIKADNSSRLTLAIWIVGNFCMDRVTPMMSQTVSTFGMDYRGLWYLVWATFNLLCLYSVYFVHQRFNLNVQPLTRFIVLCLFTLTFLQVFRYFDRDLGLDLLKPIYQNGIVAINVSVFPLACAWLARCYLNHYKEAKV